jgi:hypothetical protein
MSWLLAWLIVNALVLVWRVLVVFPQVKTKDQSVLEEGAAGSLAGPNRSPFPRYRKAA